MDRKKAEERKRQIITAQRQVETAPASGKATYLSLPKGLTLFSPQKGHSYKLVFLPWKAGKGNRSGAVGEWVTNRYMNVHRNIGPTEQHYLCPAGTGGRPCPVCEEYARVRRQGAPGSMTSDDFYKKVLAPLQAKNRELMFVHVLDDPKSPKNLMVWDESTKLFGDSFRALFTKRKEWLAYADPYEGCNVEIEAVEKKIGQSSCVDCTQGIVIEVRSEPLPDWLVEATEKWCIDKYVMELPYARLAEMLGRTGGGESPNEEAPAQDEEEPSNGQVEVEEVIGDEEEPVAEEDEVPTRRPTGRGVKRPEPEEEEPEEEVEDEEPDPEPEPPRKTAAKRPTGKK